MSRLVLTDARVRALKPAERRRFVPDSLVPGLVLQVTPQGHKSFMLRGIFPGGRNRVRRLLGEAGAMSVNQARTEARQWLTLLAQGVDPQLELRERKRQAGAEQGLTFAAVAEAYINDRMRGKRQGARGAKEIRSELVARWAERTLGSISRGDIIQVVDELRARAERTVGARASGAHARTIFAHCHSLFDWAALRHNLPSSPCDRLRPKNLGLVSRPRRRVLNDGEIRALWRACDTLGAPFGVLAKTLLCTGARRNEIANGRFAEIDADTKLWTIPASRFKSDCEHCIPLTHDLLELLGSLPRYQSSDHIFSTTYGRRLFSGFSKATARLHRLMRAELGEAMPAFCLHDLRRTMRTRLSELRIPEHVAEQAIGHAKRGLLRIYDQHRHGDEVREAFEAWHRRLRSIVTPAPANANVVALALRA
jgi:integrase